MFQVNLRRVVEEKRDQLQVIKVKELKDRLSKIEVKQEEDNQDQEEPMMMKEEGLLKDQPKAEQEGNPQQGEKINCHKDVNLSQKKNTEISIKKRKMRIRYFA